MPYSAYQRAMGYPDTPGLGAGGMGQPPPGYMNAMALSQQVEAPLDENGQIFQLVINLMSPDTRENALLELSKKREQYEDLAIILWHSFGAQTKVSLLCLN